MQWTWAHPLREPRVRATTSVAAILQRHPDTSVADIPSADKQQPIPHFGLQAASHSTHPVAYRTQGLPRLLASKQKARTHPLLTGNTPYQLLGLQAASLLTHGLLVHNKPATIYKQKPLAFRPVSSKPQHIVAYRQHALPLTWFAGSKPLNTVFSCVQHSKIAAPPQRLCVCGPP